MFSYPYGYNSDTNEGYCINAEPGTFNHECGKPANNIGVNNNGHKAMFCDACKISGHDAKNSTNWTKLAR